MCLQLILKCAREDKSWDEEHIHEAAQCFSVRTGGSVHGSSWGVSLSYGEWAVLMCMPT